MYNNYSHPETYYPRWISASLKSAIKETSILVLTGARQVGKSTLLLNEEPFKQWRYFNMDDYDVLRQVSHRPEALWAGTNQIILDEVQKVPELLPIIKNEIDRAPEKVQFVLSGSANLLLMKHVSESLAGRAIYTILDPLTLGEINYANPPQIIQQILNGDWPEETTAPTLPPDPIPLMQRGFMPALLRLPSPESFVRWWDGYVATYLERDLRQISRIDSLVDFRRVMELLALRSGQLLNQSDLARDAALSQPTTHRYLNLLETTHLYQRIPAFTTNRTTRILKSPKSFWNDPGLAVFLSGYFQEEELRKSRELGCFFETLIYHHLRVIAHLMTPPARIYFWRTMGGKEVDFVLEHGRKILAIEVKMTNQPAFSDTLGLQAFLDDHPEAIGGVLLHRGSSIRRMGERIIAVPWNDITAY